MSSSEGPKNLEIPDDLPSKLQIDQGAFLVGKTGERIYSIIWSEHAIKETKDDRQILPKFITVVEHEGWVWVKSQKANIYVLFAEESLPEEWRPAIEKTAKRLSTK